MCFVFQQELWRDVPKKYEVLCKYKVVYKSCKMDLTLSYQELKYRGYYSLFQSNTA